ncbi:hypothetical protein HDV00_008679 [Rhizophlyctis rosea]|nr:hypothetical protein HDV00_008679 [Rhizophlyctis rosea]
MALVAVDTALLEGPSSEAMHLLLELPPRSEWKSIADEKVNALLSTAVLLANDVLQACRIVLRSADDLSVLMGNMSLGTDRLVRAPLTTRNHSLPRSQYSTTHSDYTSTDYITANSDSDWTNDYHNRGRRLKTENARPNKRQRAQSDEPRPPVHGTRPNHDKRKKAILEDWLLEHINNAYPTEAEKERLMRETDMTKKQLENWFINARRKDRGIMDRVKARQNKA